MAKADYFLIVDTETTQPNKAENIPAKVADFGAIVVNRKGEIFSQCAVMVLGIYNNSDKYPLFYTSDNEGDPENIWAKAGLPDRYKRYNSMLSSGARQYASHNAINKWLAIVNGKYNPYLTAYNLAFDMGKCDNTGIDLSMFSKKFCLMKAACDKWALTKKYRQFILDNHYFKPPTKLGNMSYLTKAETMAHFVTGDDLVEPHTAIEDARDFELPILLRLLATQKKSKWENPQGQSWQNRQIKDWYIPK
jgi:hypothetical protein